MSKHQLKAQLVEGLSALSLTLSPIIIDKLLSYLELLEKWNRVFNLTAVRSPEVMVPRHLLDSLAIAKFIQNGHILDVGSGAGLPGIPLALVMPQKQFTLLDSNGKKTRFLNQVKGILTLDNVSIVQSRVERYLPETKFSTIVSRAFSDINDIMAKTKHLCAPCGHWVIMKGVYPKDELAQVRVPFEVVPVHVPQLDAKRHIVIVGVFDIE